MKIYQISSIGTFHTNHNEDCLTINEIGNNKRLIAVMDGCSMGIESHFASNLIGKVLRKITKEISFRDFREQKTRTLEASLEEITRQLFHELAFFKSRLMLEKVELLSTLIIGVVNAQSREAEILAIGDGLICSNGQYFEYEQDNKPDYLGYHLEESFDEWFAAQHQRLSLKNIQDLSISTDGIFTFSLFDNHLYDAIEEKEWVDFLLRNRKWEENENMLHRKLVELENNFGLKPTDDLSIVRIIMEK